MHVSSIYLKMKNKMKKQPGWKESLLPGRLAELLFPFLALFLLGSCSEEKGKPDFPDEKDLLWEIMPVLAPDAGNFDGVEKYGVSLYLFNEISSACYKFQRAASFGELSPFVVERGSYSLVALMTERDVPYLSYETSIEAVKDGTIVVTDMDADLPDLVLGHASVSREVGAALPLTDLQRLVGALEIRLTDVPADVNRIELDVEGLYDQVDFTGQYGFSMGTAASMRLDLGADGSTYSVRRAVMPSDMSQENVKMIFRLFRGAAAEEFVVRVSGGIPADCVTRLEGRAEEILKNYPFIGVAFRGEGEGVFPAFLARFDLYPVRAVIPAEGSAVFEEWESASPPVGDPFFRVDKPFVQMETSRGCPMGCIYCTSCHTKVRCKSPDSVRKELTMLRGRGVSEIRLLDRTFNFPPKRGAELLRIFRTEFPDLRFHLEIHPGFLDGVGRFRKIAVHGGPAFQPGLRLSNFLAILGGSRCMSGFQFIRYFRRCLRGQRVFLSPVVG